MALTYLRLTNFWSLIRATPIMNLYFLVLNLANKLNFDSLYLFTTYIICVFSNHVLKNIFKIIYNLFNVKEIPILGRGIRPDGATNCGSFLFYPDKSSTSYGMPSGHSQSIWFLVTYLILSINDKKIKLFERRMNKKYNEIIKYTSIIGLLCLGILVSYSRVEIENCHTIEQVTLGGLLGISLGYISFIFKDIVNLMFNKLF